MNKFRIPSSVQMLGQRIETRYDETLTAVDGSVGEARYGQSEIVLQTSTVAYKRTPEQIEGAYLHELIHYAFNFMGENEMRQNEKLVSILAGLLHQALQTAEYE